jgi:hypothetical protein
MTCAQCATVSTPAVIVGGLTICPVCLSSIQAATGAPATAADTYGALTVEQLAALRALRKQHRAAGGDRRRRIPASPEA